MHGSPRVKDGQPLQHVESGVHESKVRTDTFPPFTAESDLCNWQLNVKAANFAIVGMFVLLTFGCGRQKSMEDYKQTVRQGMSVIPAVREIRVIFPDCPTDHFITQYAFEKKKPVTWNTEVFFGGRYVLTYQVDVLVDYSNKTISKIIAPEKFFLGELSEIEGGVGSYARSHNFGMEKWKKIVDGKGDFSVIGIPLNTNVPLPGFDEYVRQWRKDRVDVNR